jgi:hypothetical protein
MALRSRIADEQTSSLGGWLFADLFLLIMVIGFAGFSISTEKGGPSATTGSAINRTSTSATLTGLVDAGDADAKVFFRWGASSNLSDDDQITAAQPSPVLAQQVGINVKADLAQLDSDTTYYYRLVAESAAGVSEGDVKSFKTEPVAKGPCSTAPSFIDTPFKGQSSYSRSSAQNSLLEDVNKWITKAKFVQPKIAVAIIRGGSNKSNEQGQRSAKLFWNNEVSEILSDFTTVNTASRPFGTLRLPEGRFELELFFVETANQC